MCGAQFPLEQTIVKSDSETASLFREDIKKLLAGVTRDKGELAAYSSLSTYTQSWVPAPDQGTVKRTEVDIEFLVPTQTALHLTPAMPSKAIILTSPDQEKEYKKALFDFINPGKKVHCKAESCCSFILCILVQTMLFSVPTCSYSTFL